MNRISQSLMKAVRAYLEGTECGILLREKYVKGRLFDDATAAMRLGAYFEFLLTGAVPKDGKVPQPEYQASRIKSNGGRTNGLGIDDMYEPYRTAHANKARVLEYWDRMGLVMARDKEGKLLVGRKFVKGRHEGTIDVVLEATRRVVFDDMFELRKGDRICVDIKYSGMADDRWSVHGWQWTPAQKQYHGTQAKQYHYLTDLPFFFFVVDPGGKYVRWFRIIITEDEVQAHLTEANFLFEKLNYLDELDLLEARPEVSRCEKCPLKDECKQKHTYPHPIAVRLSADEPRFEITYLNEYEY
jgi:hypothetical protein